MPSVLVTGANGLLGGQVAWTFAKRGVDVIASTHAQLDVTDAEKVRETLIKVDPGVVVHCAAMTNVDACETDPEKAFAVNAQGAENVALAARESGAAMVQVSTDYVFDGEKGNYREDDPTNPIQVYGRSKLEGEERVRAATPWHFVVRSAWIYGPGGKNFLSKLPDLAKTQATTQDGAKRLPQEGTITAVVDQRGSPTYAPDLAEGIAALVETLDYGTYHIVNQGNCTFAEFCEAAVEIMGAALRVEHVTLADLGRPAPRPRDTSLLTPRWLDAGFEPLRPWREAAEAFLTGERPLSGGGPPNPPALS
jgi:dTDP-4-dehydrorhamnose reductase